MTDAPLSPSPVEAAESYARGRLSGKRYGHTLRVAETAEGLAEAHGLDPERVRLAALLHDSAREVAPEELLREAKERGLPVRGFDEENPKILHGPVAAELSKADLGITDEGILDAVRAHTTGAVGMDDLALAVFLADKLEPARDYPGVEGLRELAKKDLREAARVSLEGSISHNEGRGKPIHPASREALEWLGDQRPEERGV